MNKAILICKHQFKKIHLLKNNNNKKNYELIFLNVKGFTNVSHPPN